MAAMGLTMSGKRVNAGRLLPIGQDMLISRFRFSTLRTRSVAFPSVLLAT